METLVVRKSEFTDRSGAKYFNTERRAAGCSVYVWFNRSDADLIFSSNQTVHDIFLEDYFEDINNPTDTELTLLELATGIIYDVHN